VPPRAILTMISAIIWTCDAKEKYEHIRTGF
jgi:hypothetical protein